MKINYTLFIILFFIIGCNKENEKINVTHDMLIGKWLFVKENTKISYPASISSDTTILKNNDTLEFDASRYCKINSSKYAWDLYSDTISICSCPLYVICDPIIFYHYYKIIEFNEKNKEMILKEEIDLNYLSSLNDIKRKETFFKYYRKIIYLR